MMMAVLLCSKLFIFHSSIRLMCARAFVQQTAPRNCGRETLWQTLLKNYKFIFGVVAAATVVRNEFTACAPSSIVNRVCWKKVEENKKTQIFLLTFRVFVRQKRIKTQTNDLLLRY